MTRKEDPDAVALDRVRTLLLAEGKDPDAVVARAVANLHAWSKGRVTPPWPPILEEV